MERAVLPNLDSMFTNRELQLDTYEWTTDGDSMFTNLELQLDATSRADKWTTDGDSMSNLELQLGYQL